ncbi:MAG: efflux RND transporter periplasmic adaptor subunit [Pseudomonadota bacterium]
MDDQELESLRIDKSKSPISSTGKRGLIRKILPVIIVLIVLLLIWSGLDRARDVKIAVVSKVYPSQGFTLLNASGYVVAQRKAAVASKATGRLEWLGVEEGSRIKEGQIIARIENKDVIASREQADANLCVARSKLEEAGAELGDATLQYERLKALVSRGVVAKTEFDAADARYRRARAAVAGAESAINAAQAVVREAAVKIEHTFIRAPFDAVVLTKNADVGDIVAPLGAAADARAAVVTIADMASLQVEADVAESNLSKIRVGQPCEIQLDAIPEERYNGVVHMIVPTADRAKATVMTKVRFLAKDSRILPEMSATVAFLEKPVGRNEKNPRTAVDTSAVASRKNRKVVFLVQDGKARMIGVVPGQRLGDMTEIVRGVNVGDKLVVNPPPDLKDGAKVKVGEE